MSSIFTNLLFMHGHITNLELARRLAEAPAPTDTPSGTRKHTPTAAVEMRKTAAAPLAGQISATGPRAGSVIVTALRWATAR